ncbi:MAG TPA: hypothetical protein VK195_13980 [Burkholderiaceae bacterium]|nr:hypothetical protein [Burkholderiaceae bacterium]
MHPILPEPHQLDSDWRFAADSVQVLSDLLINTTPLLLGMPSVARRLESLQRRVLLVDRQPLQQVTHHQRIDPSAAPPLALEFPCAAMDPPWYLDTFFRWISWAAQSIGIGGRIYCTLWPVDTRPAAQQERQALMAWLSRWSKASVVSDALMYETPLFERNSAVDKHAISLRRGDLLVIDKQAPTELLPPPATTCTWHRYCFGAYQLAVKLKLPPRAGDPLRTHPMANGWIWPSVSRRAPGIDDIDIWSSRNEVAICSRTDELMNILDQPGINFESLKDQLAAGDLGGLLEWELGKIKFKEHIKWMHRA